MTHKSILLTACILCLTQVAALSQSTWPQFRGANGQGIAGDQQAYPAHLDTTQNLLWKCQISEGLSSPVIWDNRLFLTGIRGDTLETLCIDTESGKILWSNPLHPEKIERVHPVSSPAAPSVATDGQRVFAYFGSYGLVCYDYDGNLLWEKKIPYQGNMYGTAVSPVLANDMLILSRDADENPWLEALNPATGEIIWHTDRPGFKANWSTPVVHDNLGRSELLVYGIWWLKAYNLETGKELWSYPGLTDEPATHPITANGLVYVTTYNMKTNPEVLGLPTWDSLIRLYDRDDDRQLTLDEARANQSILSRYDADGEGDHPLWGFHRWLDADKNGKVTETEWQKIIGWVDSFQQDNALLAIRPPEQSGQEPRLVWRHTFGVPECPSPVCAHGLIFMVKNGGIISCLDALPGELKYQEKLGAGGPYYASPVYADGKIYFASTRGDVTVIEAAPTFRILSQQHLGDRIMATPALVKGRVYMRSMNQVWAFGKK